MNESRGSIRSALIAAGAVAALSISAACSGDTDLAAQTVAPAPATTTTEIIIPTTTEIIISTETTASLVPAGTADENGNYSYDSSTSSNVEGSNGGAPNTSYSNEGGNTPSEPLNTSVARIETVNTIPNLPNSPEQINTAEDYAKSVEREADLLVFVNDKVKQVLDACSETNLTCTWGNYLVVTDNQEGKSTIISGFYEDSANRSPETFHPTGISVRNEGIYETGIDFWEGKIGLPTTKVDMIIKNDGSTDENGENFVMQQVDRSGQVSKFYLKPDPSPTETLPGRNVDVTSVAEAKSIDGAAIMIITAHLSTLGQ
jgi:hypothetical protein